MLPGAIGRARTTAKEKHAIAGLVEPYTVLQERPFAHAYPVHSQNGNVCSIQQQEKERGIMLC